MSLLAAALAALAWACDGTFSGGDPDAPDATPDAPGLLASSSGLTLLPGFQEQVVLSGLVLPTTVEFAPDGRIFVAEKSGVIRVFAGLDDPAGIVFADLRASVHNFWDRGLLGMALHPDFPDSPYVYVLYTLDAAPGSSPPTWGTESSVSDGCPTPPGATADGCRVGGRLSRLAETANGTAGPEVVLIENWCQQFPSHSIGSLAFGPDGALYVGAGDGASFYYADYGQTGNTCGDPPAGPGGTQSPATSRGGAFRSQNLDLASNGVATYDGKILRVDPLTGAALPDNPLAGSAVPGASRIVASGLRNPFRFTVRPGTSELWIGDVGWNTWEEINRIPNPVAGPVNFGWPCYEGAPTQGGYQALGNAACAALAASSGAQAPFWAYRHDDPVVVGDSCATGSSSVTGLAFLPSGRWPAQFSNALFFADYTRNCIWYMPAGAGGLPDPAQRALFVAAAATPIDLTAGPGGELYYVDFLGGTLRRLRHLGSNQAPTAVATATPASGPAPLVVELDASGSTDPDAELLTYAWDLDGDGAYDDASGVTTSVSFGTAGTHRVGLRVTDTLGASAATTLDIPVGAPPTATIVTPAEGTLWTAGQEIPFSGTAAESDGTILPATAMTWQLVVLHCPGGCHQHVIQTWSGVASGSFTAPQHDWPSYLELRLSATTATGLTVLQTRQLQPRTVDLAFASSPPGLQLAVGSESLAAPFTRTFIQGTTVTVAAYSPQVLAGVPMEFSAWSDGGAAVHSFPAPSTAQTLTATYLSGGGLPDPWQQADVGASPLPGSAFAAGGAFTVSGAGADIWGTSDAFHFVWQPLSGDGSVVARLASQSGTNAWAKAGIMIRETLSAGSSHAFMALTPANGAAFQRRQTTGSGSQHTGLAGMTAPRWLRLVRSGTTFSGYVSPDGSAWTLVGSATVAMGTSALAGLAVTSHDAAQLGTATFDGVSVGATGGPPPNQPPTVSLTAPQAGASYVAPATVGLSATPADSDGSVVRVDFLANGSVVATTTAAPWTASWSGVQAGTYAVSARAVDNLGAEGTGVPVSITVTTAPGQTGLPSPWVMSDVGTTGAAGSAGEAGGSFAIQGAGADIWGTTDAFAFVYQSLAGDGQIVARLATQQNTNAWAKAGVMIRESLAPGAPHAFMALTPANGAAFQRRPILNGSSQHTGLAGVTVPRWLRLVRAGTTFSASVSPDGTNWTLVGTATVTLGTQALAGLAVTSHAAGTLGTVTFDSVAVNGAAGPPANLPPSVTLVSPAAGTQAVAGSTLDLSAQASDTDGTVVRVEFYAGATLIASDPSAPYAASWAGVPAGNWLLTARAVDDDGAQTTSAAIPVDVTAPSGDLPSPWVTADVGSPSPAGSAAASGGTFTVRGAGSDIWGTADAFRFAYRTLSGDGTIIARLDSQSNTNAWAKAGVMIRESLAPGARHAFMALTPSNGAAFQRRPTADGYSQHTGLAGLTSPRWLRLQRVGSTFTGSVSADGVTWTVVGSATVTLPGAVLAGLAVTSHQAGVLGTAVFGSVSP